MLRLGNRDVCVTLVAVRLCKAMKAARLTMIQRIDPVQLAAQVRAKHPPIPRSSLTALMNNDQNRIGVFLRRITSEGSSSWPRFPADVWSQKVKAFTLTGGHYATVGTAFGWWLRLRLDPQPHIAEARLAERWLGKKTPAVLDELVARLRDPDLNFLEGWQAVERVAVVLTWCEQVYRSSGMAMASEPLAALSQVSTLAAAMALAPKPYLDQLQQLGWLAEEKLFPFIESQGGCRFGIPLGHEQLAADADFLAGTVLMEVKTTQGTKRSSAVNEFRIDPDLVRQMIGYVLLDPEDRYGIQSVGVYGARFGILWTIPVERLIRISGDVAEDLPALRAAFASLWDD